MEENLRWNSCAPIGPHEIEKNNKVMNNVKSILEEINCNFISFHVVGSFAKMTCVPGKYDLNIVLVVENARHVWSEYKNIRNRQKLLSAFGWHSHQWKQNLKFLGRALVRNLVFKAKRLIFA